MNFEQTNEREKVWDAWEKRNPGVAHPERVVEQARQQRLTHEREFDRLHADKKSIAEQGRAARDNTRRI